MYPISFGSVCDSSLNKLNIVMESLWQLKYLSETDINQLTCTYRSELYFLISGWSWNVIINIIVTVSYKFNTFSVKAMLLIIDCKNKITWKKLDHLQNGSVISSEGSVALEEKELLMTVENGDTVSMDKVKEEVTKAIATKLVHQVLAHSFI